VAYPLRYRLLAVRGQQVLQWGHSLPALAAAVMLMAAGCQQARAQVSPPLEKRTVLAQAGSTGGSVGKRNKSISGEEESSPDAGPGRSTHASREEAFPKTIQLNEHWHGMNWTVSLRNIGGSNYQGTWSNGYATTFAVTGFARNSMKMERKDTPGFGAVTGSYTGTRTGNRAAGDASISNGANSKWDASW
jgi:hypothetical protein